MAQFIAEHGQLRAEGGMEGQERRETQAPAGWVRPYLSGTKSVLASRTLFYFYFSLTVFLKITYHSAFKCTRVLSPRRFFLEVSAYQ